MDLSGDLLIVEILPVLKVVEVDGIEDGAGISDANSGKNASACRVVVVVADDSCIVGINGRRVKGTAFLVEDPLLALGVGRLGFLDVSKEGVAFDAESVEGHLIKAGAGCRIVAVKLADSVERSFLPEAGKVKHAERTCDSGGDERNDLAHFVGIFWFRLKGSQRKFWPQGKL